MTEPDKLTEHLAASGRRGVRFAVFLLLLVGVYVFSVFWSNWSIGVVIAGAIVCLVVIGLAYRIRKADLEADAVETDRLINEQRRRYLEEGS